MTSRKSEKDRHTERVSEWVSERAQQTQNEMTKTSEQGQEHDQAQRWSTGDNNFIERESKWNENKWNIIKGHICEWMCVPMNSKPKQTNQPTNERTNE